MKRLIVKLSLAFVMMGCGGAPFTTAPDVVDPPNLQDDGGDGGPAPTPTTPSPSPTTVPTTMPNVVPPTQVADSGDAGNPSVKDLEAGSVMVAEASPTPDPPDAGSPTADPPDAAPDVVAMTDPTCSGSATQACGNCNSGTQTRTCQSGVWSAWGNCDNATPATLLGVGEGNFTISFDLTATGGEQAVLNQRTDCLGTASAHAFWDITYNPPNCDNGALQVQTYSEVQGLTTFCTNGSVSGKHLQFHRVSGVMTFSENGIATNTWPDISNLAGLAALATGTDVCSTVLPFTGTITNVCVEKQ